MNKNETFCKKMQNRFIQVIHTRKTKKGGKNSVF